MNQEEHLLAKLIKKIKMITGWACFPTHTKIALCMCSKSSEMSMMIDQNNMSINKLAGDLCQHFTSHRMQIGDNNFIPTF